MGTSKQSGFAHVYLLIPVVVVLLVGVIGWRLYSAQQEKNNALSQAQQNNESKAEKPLSLAEQEELKAKTGDIPPTAEITPTVATTKTTPTKAVDNSTNGATPQTQKAAPQTSTPPKTTTSVLRPTADFCAQKNGASFTNVWFTGTGTYTYDGYAWENGYSYTLPRVSKTESGTPLRNSDTMQIFDVVAYGTQPQWAVCSEKSGYVMVYYTVPDSPYTFNALAEYGHLSLQKP